MRIQAYFLFLGSLRYTVMQLGIFCFKRGLGGCNIRRSRVSCLKHWETTVYTTFYSKSKNIFEKKFLKKCKKLQSFLQCFFWYHNHYNISEGNSCSKGVIKCIKSFKRFCLQSLEESLLDLNTTVFSDYAVFCPMCMIRLCVIIWSFICQARRS